MTERELELSAQIDGLKLAVGVLLTGSPDPRQYPKRFGEMEEEARKHNGHPGTIEILRYFRELTSGISDPQ